MRVRGGDGAVGCGVAPCGGRWTVHALVQALAEGGGDPSPGGDDPPLLTPSPTRVAEESQREEEGAQQISATGHQLHGLGRAWMHSEEERRARRGQTRPLRRAAAAAAVTAAGSGGRVEHARGDGGGEDGEQGVDRYVGLAEGDHVVEARGTRRVKPQREGGERAEHGAHILVRPDLGTWPTPVVKQPNICGGGGVWWCVVVCGGVWCGVVVCGGVWCGVVWCGVVLPSSVTKKLPVHLL